MSDKKKKEESVGLAKAPQMSNHEVDALKYVDPSTPLKRLLNVSAVERLTILENQLSSQIRILETLEKGGVAGPYQKGALDTLLCIQEILQELK